MSNKTAALAFFTAGIGGAITMFCGVATDSIMLWLAGLAIFATIPVIIKDV